VALVAQPGAFLAPLVAQLSSAGGGVLQLLTGSYSGPVVVPANVSLVGEGWGTKIMGPLLPPVAQRGAETASAAAPVIRLSGSGSSLRHLAIVGRVGTAIEVTGPDALVEDVFIECPDIGLSIVGTGRTSVKRLHGQPLLQGIVVDDAQDVVRFDDVHFWPYYKLGASSAGTAITLLRADNPQLSNIFAFGYDVGLLLGCSKYGSSHKVHMVNADFDSCATAIVVHTKDRQATLFGSAVTGQPSQRPGTTAVHLVSGAALVDLWSSQFLDYAKPVTCAPGTKGSITINGRTVNA